MFSVRPYFSEYIVYLCLFINTLRGTTESSISLLESCLRAFSCVARLTARPSLYLLSDDQLTQNIDIFGIFNALDFSV